MAENVVFKKQSKIGAIANNNFFANFYLHYNGLNDKFFYLRLQYVSALIEDKKNK